MPRYSGDETSHAGVEYLEMGVSTLKEVNPIVPTREWSKWEFIAKTQMHDSAALSWLVVERKGGTPNADGPLIFRR